MRRAQITVAAFLILLAGLWVGVSLVSSSSAAGTASSLEAAKKADAAASEGVKSAEANLVAQRATKAVTAEAVVAAEANEAPKEEPPATGPVVNAIPTGPTGAWSVAFADGFAQPVGATGSRWHIKTNAHGCCGNGNETSSEVASAVHWSEANGLELRCEGLACSGVSTNNFTYQLGRGASFAFETVARLPDNTAGGEDPGFWSISTTRWPPEFDFFEYWGWHKPNPLESLGGFPVYHGTSGQRELYWKPTAEYFSSFHRYTTVVDGSTFAEYIDGKRLGSFTEPVNTDAMNIILTHALREYTNPRNTSFDVRSVAVYEDSAHAGQFVANGGVAPGTVVK